LLFGVDRQAKLVAVEANRSTLSTVAHLRVVHRWDALATGAAAN
jgi:hypothetical protein